MLLCALVEQFPITSHPAEAGELTITYSVDPTSITEVSPAQALRLKMLSTLETSNNQGKRNYRQQLRSALAPSHPAP